MILSMAGLLGKGDEWLSSLVLSGRLLAAPGAPQEFRVWHLTAL